MGGSEIAVCLRPYSGATRCASVREVAEIQAWRCRNTSDSHPTTAHLRFEAFRDLGARVSYHDW